MITRAGAGARRPRASMGKARQEGNVTALSMAAPTSVPNSENDAVVAEEFAAREVEAHPCATRLLGMPFAVQMIVGRVLAALGAAQLLSVQSLTELPMPQ